MFITILGTVLKSSFHVKGGTSNLEFNLSLGQLYCEVNQKQLINSRGRAFDYVNSTRVRWRKRIWPNGQLIISLDLNLNCKTRHQSHHLPCTNVKILVSGIQLTLIVSESPFPRVCRV